MYVSIAIMHHTLLLFLVQFQALDDSVMTNVRNLNKKAGMRSPMNKENNGKVLHFCKSIFSL